MSDTPTPQPVRRRSILGHMTRGAAWLLGSILVLVLVLVAGVTWYTGTADFQRRVGKEVISALGDATGGRVELRGLSLDLWHLAVEVDGLVIHGLEGPGEAPYLSADKIQVRIKITSLFSHTAGSGLASHVGLNLLRVVHPQVHLIIDKNGKTNQPVPKHPSTSTEPLQDTLLDLKANELALVDGVALLNDKAIPFDLAARDLNAQIHYLTSTDRYGITLDLADLRTRMGTAAEAQSKLHIEGELGRDAADLKKFEFDTGKASVIQVTGSLNHFAKPEWQVAVNGSLELKQVSVLGGVDGLTGGVLDLNINGHNCTTAPAVAQTHPRFWQRRHPAPTEKPSTKVLPPDPDCKAGYLVAGAAKLHNAGFQNQYVRLHDINGGAQLHITPTELLFTALSGYLPGGGSASGELRISDWLGEVAPAAPASSPTTVGRCHDCKQDRGRCGSATYRDRKRAPGGDGSRVPGSHGQQNSAADDYGGDRDQRVWRSGLRYIDHRAGQGGMGRTRGRYLRYRRGRRRPEVPADRRAAPGCVAEHPRDRRDAGPL